MTNRPRVSLGALMGGVALLALTLGFGMPEIRSAVEHGSKATRLIAFGLGVFVIYVQICYWSTIIPLGRRLRRRR